MPAIETDQAIEATEKKCRNLSPELNVILMSFRPRPHEDDCKRKR